MPLPGHSSCHPRRGRWVISNAMVACLFCTLAAASGRSPRRGREQRLPRQLDTGQARKEAPHRHPVAAQGIGYVHRGIEAMVEKVEYQDFGTVAERICGLCSITARGRTVDSEVGPGPSLRPMSSISKPSLLVTLVVVFLGGGGAPCAARQLNRLRKTWPRYSMRVAGPAPRPKELDWSRLQSSALRPGGRSIGEAFPETGGTNGNRCPGTDGPAQGKICAGTTAACEPRALSCRCATATVSG